MMFTFLVFVSYKPDVVGLHLRNNLTPRCGVWGNQNKRLSYC